MTTIYHLRDSGGVLKAIIPKKNAMGIFTEVDGEWKSFKSDIRNSRAYYITRGVTWTFFQTHNNEAIISIVLWEGDRLVEINE